MTITAKSSHEEWVGYMRDKHGEDCAKMSKVEIIQRATQLEGLDYAVSQPPASARSKEAQEIAKHKRVKILIPSTEAQGGNRPVFVGVNGVSFLIKRDEEVDVPVPVYEVLRNARHTVYKQNDDGSLVPREVPAYPFSVLSAVG